MNDHDFCRVLLAQARTEAKQKGVKIPRNVTAMKSTDRVFFVEADGVSGEFIKGDCGFEARARYINTLIERAEPMECKIIKHTESTSKETVIDLEQALNELQQFSDEKNRDTLLAWLRDGRSVYTNLSHYRLQADTDAD